MDQTLLESHFKENQIQISSLSLKHLLTSMLREILSKIQSKDIEQYEVKPTKMSEQMVGMGKKEYYPNICLSSESLPEIKDWEVDGEYVIVLKVKQTSKSMNTEGKKETYHADFDIKEIAYLDKEDDKKEDKMEGEDDDEVKTPPLMKMYAKK